MGDAFIWLINLHLFRLLKRGQAMKPIAVTHVNVLKSIFRLSNLEIEDLVPGIAQPRDKIKMAANAK